MLRDDPVGFLSGIVATLYTQAAEQEQVKGDCGYTPLEHFIIGEDGIARLQTNHIHANLITVDRIYVPPKTQFVMSNEKITAAKTIIA